MDKMNVLRQVDKGYEVFPLKNGSKVPACYWQEESTKNVFDAPEISGNYGINCNNLVVIDVDAPEGLEWLEENEQRLADVPCVNTPSGGKHFYFFRAVGSLHQRELLDIDIKNSVGRIADGVDVRAKGGYVVGPGSEIEEGKWEGELPDVEELPCVPDWLLEELEKVSATHGGEETGRQEIRDPEAYLIAKVEGSADEVAEAPVGERNNKLNACALSVFKTAIGAGLSPDPFASTLKIAGRAAGLPRDEVDKTLKSALNAAHGRPREVSVETARPYSKGSVADSFRESEGRILYHPKGDIFYVYCGTSYEPVSHLDLESRVRAHIKSRKWLVGGGEEEPPEIVNVGPPTRGFIKDIIGDLTADAIRDGREAPLDPPCWVHKENGRGWVPDSSRDNEHYISMKNGIVNFETGLVSPHDENYFCLNTLPFKYDSAAECPEWEATVADWFEFDEDQIRHLQEVMGYALSSNRKLHACGLLVGPPRSGKGVTSRILRLILGRHNVGETSFDSLSQEFGMANLYGKHMASISEDIDHGRIKSVTSLLKRITGEDPVRINRKYKPTFSTTLKCFFLMQSNELPQFPDDSGAMSERIQFVQFKKSYCGREDRGLEDRLAKELPGIFNWCREGYLRLMERGEFEEPASSAETRQLQKEINSPIQAFLNECCVIDSDAYVPKDLLYAEYRRWCNMTGHNPLNKTKFGSKIRGEHDKLFPSHDYTTRRGPKEERVWSYHGIDLEESIKATHQRRVDRIKKRMNS